MKTMAQCIPIALLILLCLFCSRATGVSSTTLLEDIWNTTTDNFTNYDEDVGEARKKKRGGKNIIALLFGAIMIKAIIFPLAVKAMAVMSTIAVFMSTLSLIVSSMIGYAKLAMKAKVRPIRLISVNEKHHHDPWEKDDGFVPDKYYPLEPVEHNEHIGEAHHYYIV